MRILFVSALVGALAACSPLGGFGEFQPSDGGVCGTVAAAVAGTWRITGEGTRSGCEDEAFDAPRFRLRSAPLRVQQRGALLSLASDEGAGFLLEGRIEGSCVTVETREQDGEDELLYTWDGIYRAGRIEGSFFAEGPSSCVSEGDFEIAIELD